MDVKKIAKDKRVLVLEGYCKQSLPYIRGFRDLGCEVTVLCKTKLDCCYASRLPHHKILGVCDFDKPKESEQYIIKLIESGNYDIVFPPFEFSARILSHNKGHLSKFATIIANEPDIFDRANDKEEVMKVCTENNLPCPKTLFNIASTVDVIASGIVFPIIIKPKSMFGARGFHIFHNASELKEYVDANAIDLSTYVVQECIPIDSEVMAGNVYIDRNGEVKSSFLYVCKHLYPEDGGTSTMNVLIDRQDIHDTIKTLTTKMNLRGVIGVDLMIDSRDNIAKVIEINPRSSHAITIGFKGGCNLCQQILEDSLGLPVSEFMIQRTDFCLRIGQTDALWFLTSPNRFKKSPRRMGYKHTYDQMFYWDDPIPWFAYLFENLLAFKKKMAEKKK